MSPTNPSICLKMRIFAVLDRLKRGSKGGLDASGAPLEGVWTALEGVWNVHHFRFRVAKSAA